MIECRACIREEFIKKFERELFGEQEKKKEVFREEELLLCHINKFEKIIPFFIKKKIVYNLLFVF